MLLSLNNRSKAYLQAMLKNKMKPGFILLFESTAYRPPPEQFKITDKPDLKTSQKHLFDIEESLEKSIQTNSIPYEKIQAENINNSEIIKKISSRPENIFIYSGPGGTILKEEILNCGKKFLHVHPGRLPDFRGSTTIYYHILSENNCWVSAFLLEKNIDTGPLIKSKSYPLPDKDINIDYIYDPYIRSQLLIEVLEDYAATGKIHTSKQSPNKGDTFFIIHPVLKHIAILSLESLHKRNAKKKK